MKTMYIECNMGAAGDMLMAALLELLPNPDGFIKRMNQLGIPGVTVSRETSVKCGITGTHIRVMVRGKEEESLDIPWGMDIITMTMVITITDIAMGTNMPMNIPTTA